MAIQSKKSKYKTKAAPHDRKLALLYTLAHNHGVQTSYTDVLGIRRQAGTDSLLLVLSSLGIPVTGLDDVPDALRSTKLSAWKKRVPPVSVAWAGRVNTVEIRLPQIVCAGSIARLHLENGDVRSWQFDAAALQTSESGEVEGIRYVVKELPLPEDLPPGYHDIEIELCGNTHLCRIICAPEQVYCGEQDEKLWGVFLPTYALRTRYNWGAGDFSDIRSLQEWISGFGGKIVATLPFLSAFLDQPFEPSPYSPASRLFWNEFYLNPGQIPELEGCPEALEAIQIIEKEKIEGLRSTDLVDYRGVMALKQQVLRALARHFFTSETSRRSEFQEFTKRTPDLEDYARFRAVMEHRHEVWQKWPEPLRSGTVAPSDYDPESMKYHMFVQWLCHEQISTLAAGSGGTEAGLYLDLPLGVHGSSWDTWRKRSLFLQGLSGGAPPDVIFTDGQDWGFPPLHPHAIREDGYRYVSAFLRSIMAPAQMMRIDHVAGLHRIYCIPNRMHSSEGVYVRYRSEELYAVLSLESHLNRCMLLGEDLGTVPKYVDDALDRHGIQKMFVVQYELESDEVTALQQIPENCTASLNTHDMAPFGGYMDGTDIDSRREVGLLNDVDSENERNKRSALLIKLSSLLGVNTELSGEAFRMELTRKCLALLGSSEAKVVLINLEDLWLETRPQNMPGTSTERPNWCRKARYELEEIAQLQSVKVVLEEINKLRLT